MKQSYLDYSMSVIVSRALPDVKDGLKPVHRRILYAMYDMGMFHNKPYKKCARIVGETLGKYHPHGDQAVYDTLVRMAQSFSLRYPLIDGQGNFGSVDGDPPAAMRYTEARLAKISDEMTADLDKNTVDFVPNFDASLKEPVVMPSRLPNLLVNGSSGIAVAMATNIPSHNLSETVDAIAKVIDEPDIDAESLVNYVKGPDFPTGGIILGRSGIMSYYSTGRGRVIIRGKIETEESKSGKRRIIVKELPYMVNKSKLIEDIAACVREKRIKGITNMRDESDKEGMRIVIDVSRDTPTEFVLNQLYKHTQLQDTFGVIMLVLVDGQPKVLNMKQMIEEFIKHRKNVVIRRTKFELNKAESRVHILEGLITALNNIDAVVKLIKSAKGVSEAKKELIERYKLSVKQSEAILDMKLQRLTNLEQNKIRDEHKNLLEVIKQLKEILADDKKVYDIIKRELFEIKKKYGDERKTEIVSVDLEEEIDEEKLVKEEQIVIMLTRDNYIKRQPLDIYKSQRRGGKGIIGTKTKEEDIVTDTFVANTHNTIMFFTNKGKVYWMKAYKIPDTGRYARGKAILNLLDLEPDEKVVSLIPIKDFKEGKYLVMATKNGLIKKTELMKYSNLRKGGIIAIKLKEEDELVDTIFTDGNKEMIIATRKGYAIRFKEQDVRFVGRASMGVRGIRLREDDFVVGMETVDDEKSLLTITENGYGKRTLFHKYRVTRRGGKGIINLRTTNKTGHVIGIASVAKEDDIIVTTTGGLTIRTPVSEISTIGRATQGVRIIKLNENDKVASFVTAVKDES